MERTFTVDEARALLAQVRPAAQELVVLRADLTEAVAARRLGDESRPLADLKALEARIGELLDGFRAQGIDVKGFAPLLLDFPMIHDDRQILLCWLEGEPELAWYHDAALGFAGRRPLADLDRA
jgi:hypothetical protein